MRGELDWIVMKEANGPQRRYETANSFAMDVQHLADEPSGLPAAGATG